MLHSVAWQIRMNLLDERATLHFQCRFSALKMTAWRNFQVFITMYHNARRYNETMYRCLTLGGQFKWINMHRIAVKNTAIFVM
jgi:hypothetical protein